MSEPSPIEYREPDPIPEALADQDNGDFAAEHDETTFAENVPGGPERAREPESPRGHAGTSGL